MLLISNVAGIIYISTHRHEYLFNRQALVFQMLDFFDLRQEGNFPTFYSVLLLFTSSILLFGISIRQKNSESPTVLWLILGVIFVFLSLDEMTEIHETIDHSFLRVKFNFSGYLINAWVVPYSIAVFFIFLIYLKFIFKLPRRIAILFVISGAIYVLGAIGFEMIGGRQYELHGRGIIVISLGTVEEFLEILGISIFIYSLILYISLKDATITIKFRK